MSLQRTRWEDLAENLRSAIQDQTGPVLKAQTVSEGLNSEIAAVLCTSTGKVFIKGLRSDHPRVWTQQMESMINPYVIQVAPRLQWHIETDGWNILGFEHINGRHADYSPGSGDILKVVDAIRLLEQVHCPDLPLKRAEQRWAPYMDDTSAHTRRSRSMGTASPCVGTDARKGHRRLRGSKRQGVGRDSTS